MLEREAVSHKFEFRLSTAVLQVRIRVRDDGSCEGFRTLDNQSWRPISNIQANRRSRPKKRTLEGERAFSFLSSHVIVRILDQLDGAIIHNRLKLSPSQFMRELRPEYYSDTEDQASYVLDAPTLEYHLDTITQRNQTHDFEIFCRKLCERTVCPNLRPQTGPEGGGDSKADTETYPVADEIAALTYVGEPKGGRERWAFAFSAKATWADKVRKDVEGIVETGRPYNKIICVTSRFAKAKDRARVEDELSTKYGVPVVIHDRSWIVKEVIENDRKDLAFNYLKIGEAKSDPLRLGPTDYSRTQQLAAIERSIDDPEAFRGMERQRVTEALIAAKLSRNLERPRTETDGRFLRAVRLAETEGTNVKSWKRSTRRSGRHSGGLTTSRSSTIPMEPSKRSHCNPTTPETWSSCATSFNFW
jgi:hypothetical protein